MSEAGPHAAIARLLAGCQVLTLATSGPRGPWAASVFYASDAQFRLYFVSDAGTRHARDMAADPRVALTIGPEPAGWHEVRGLQVEGEATRLAGAERAAALSLYLAKYPAIAALHSAPRTKDEEIIAARLLHTPFWCVTPRLIRLVDNSRGFGHREEWHPAAAGRHDEAARQDGGGGRLP